jgi:hypothetical protein
MEGDRDFAQITIFLAGYKDDVVAFAQITHSDKGIWRCTRYLNRIFRCAVAFSYIMPNFDPNRVNLWGQTRKWYYQVAITLVLSSRQGMLAPWLPSAQEVDPRHSANGN